MLLSPLVVADATEQNTATPTVSGSTITQTQPSGLDITQTFSGSSFQGLAGGQSLGGKGGVAGNFSPTVSTTTPTNVNQINIAGCARPAKGSTLVCANRGTLTVDFQHPTTNPVLHIAGLGGYNTNSGQALLYNATLKPTGSTPSGAAPVVNAGTNLSVVDGTILSTNPRASASCSDTLTDQLGFTITNGATAGCGSVQFSGTYSQIVFQIDLQVSCLTNSSNTACTAPAMTTTQADEYVTAWTNGLDFGDAPTSYNGTVSATAPAAQHVHGGLRLGSGITEDSGNSINPTQSPVSNATATGDTDDAFTSLPNIIAQGASTYSLTVPISGATKAGTVSGWIDFNKNGLFDAGEKATQTFAANATSAVLAFSKPANIATGTTFARFRTAFDAADAANPNGAAASGEVEDYQVNVVNEVATVDFTKSAGAVQDTNSNGLQDAGDRVTYTFTVTNTGNTALSSVAISDPKIPSVTCNATTLAVGASTTCTGTYTLTQADVTAGNVANTATVTATSSTGAAVSKTASANRSVTQTTAATLTKTAGAVVDANSNSRTDVGDTIAYTFVVTNSGNQPLTNTVVNDAKVGAVTCPAGTIAPGGTKTCTATYTLTQADVDAGQVVNSATATVTSAAGSATTSAATATRTFTGVKSFNFNKSAGGVVDANSSGSVNAGDTITYTFTFQNTGSTSLNTPTVTDAKVGAVTCPTGTIAPNASVSCTKTYTLTQADVDAGSVNNTATGNVRDPQGTALTAKTDSTSTAITPNNTLTIAKSASAPNYGANGTADPGDTITYSFTITNTGGSTLTAPTVNDPKIGNVTCSTGSLAPGASVTCSKVYALTQADIDAAKVDNSATATATRPNGATVTSTPSTVSTTITRNPNLVFSKQAGAVTDANSNGKTDVGDTITYTFLLQNSGNVTLNAVGVSDPKVGPVSCSATTIAVGQTLSCTKTYALTQTDLDSGAVNNNATATATPAGSTTAITRTGSTSSPITVGSSITITKTAGAVNDTTAPTGPSTGDTVPYSFVVTNTGNTTLNTVAVTDSKIASVSCPATTLAPGASTTCTGTYTLTQTDVNAGKVDNTASVTARKPDNTNVTATGQNSKTFTPTSSFVFTKQAGSIVDANTNNKVDAGDTITYTFTFQNNGATTLNGASVTDAKIGTVTCPTANVAPGASTTCSKVYTLTQTDVNSGSVNNTATGTMNAPTGLAAPANRTDSTSTAITPANTLQLVKTAGAVQVGSNNRADAGETLTYTFTITNTGNQTLTDPAVSDPKVGTVTCATGSLAPGASQVCTKTYTLTQADIDAGAISNTATATAKSPSNATVTSNSSTANTTITAAPAIQLAKSAGTPVDVNSNGRTDTGDTITYSFSVQNTGNVTLNPVTVTDTKIGAITCPTGALAPGATTSCTPKQYTVTQADVDAGSVPNTATASGKPPTGANVTSSDSTSTPTTGVSTLSVTKTAGAVADTNSSGRTDVGDTVPYTITVQNTGTRTLTQVAVTDTKIPTLSCSPTTLAAGASATCTGSYVLTQADVDAGQVVNNATATAKDPSNTTVTGAGTSTKTLSTTSSFTFNKSAGAITEVVAPAGSSAGDTITYTFTFTNTGATTLKTPTVTDAKVGAVTNCPTGTVAPGTSVSCSKVYTLTQTDVDAGSVNNTATGQLVANAAGSPAPSPATRTDSTSTTVTPTNVLQLTKTAAAPVDANSSGRLDAGDTITYSFAVKNNGAATLNTVAVSDPKVGTVTCPTGNLAPGATITCSKAYTITQADLDAGTIQNSASATAKTPAGATVTAPTATITTSVTQSPSVGLTKEITRNQDLNGNGKTDAGDRLSYRFTVFNTGNVTLNPITVTDAKLGGTISCPGAPLAPGGSIQCPIVNWTITQAEVDAGSVQNTGSVSAKPPTGNNVTASASASYPTTGDSSLTVTKTAGTTVDFNNTNRLDAGDRVPYTITVLNSGTRTVTNVAVTDPKIPSLSCSPTTLASGASASCTGTYTLTQADIDAGTVANTATATATSSAGQSVTASGSTNKALDPTSTFTFDKSAGLVVDQNGNGRTDVGDRITYTFTFQNTGASTLRNPTVADPKLAAVTCPTGNVAPGATVTCPGTYTLTQTDIDSGSVNNTATGTMSGLAGRPDPSPASKSDTTSTPLAATNQLTLTKTAAAPADPNGNGRVDVGETILYTFAAKNNGTQTLSLLQILDPKVGGITCADTTIEPGTTITCTKSYTVTQADIDNGGVSNTASASASTPNGQTLSSPTTTINSTITRVPAVNLTKTAAAPTDVNGNGKVDAGDTIAYSFVVTNTGNVTLDPVTVSDPKVGAITCPTSPLVPGNQASCAQKVYTITQADVDAGAVQNTATVTAKPPGVAAITGTSSTSTSTTVSSTLTFTKVAGNVVDSDGNGPDAGDLLPYTFTVTNTGTSTLTGVTITDSKIQGNVSCDRTSLAPGQAATCTGNHVLTQAEVDAGQIQNTASVTAQSPSGPVTTTASATKNVTPVSSFTFTKTAGTRVDVDGSGSATAGDTIPYTFTFTNTGTTTLNGAAVSDPQIGPVTCATTSINPTAPGNTLTCTKSYTLTQADVDAGAVNNTATGTMSAGANVPQPTSKSASVTSQLQANPTLEFTKTAGTRVDVDSSGTATAGDTVTYTFTTRNTGNVTLNLLNVDDPKVDASSCQRPTIAPNETSTCTKTYTLTQADVDAGGVVNTASAYATNPNTGAVIRSAQSSATSTATQVAQMTFTKISGGVTDFNDNGRTDAGDRIAYTFTFRNDGNVSLDGISVSDPKVGNVSCPTGPLAPGATRTCGPVQYTITQADIDSGSVQNTASGSATSPTGVTLTSSKSTSTPTAGSSSLTASKVAGTLTDPDSNGPDVGDTLPYSFTLTNTGTTSLSTVGILDTKLSPTAQPCSPATLQPGQVATCSGSYVLTQADVDAGKVDNSALGQARDPQGVLVQSPAATATKTFTPTSSFSFDKQSAPISLGADNRPSPGDTIDYTFVFQNTGGTTLSAPTVTDPKIGAVTCPTGSVAPGTSVSCTKTYALTQTDIDTGTVDNTATGAMTAGATSPQPANRTDSTSTPIAATTTLTLTKSAGTIQDTNSSGRVDAGDRVPYSFLVTNTGNVTLTGVAIDDAKVPAASCPTTTLAPGASTTCTGTYQLTVADLDAGQVLNSATATAKDPANATVTSPTSQVGTSVTQTPSIFVDKATGATTDANNNGVFDAGDTIVYTFEIRNSGTVTLSSVSIADPKVGAVTCPTGDLAPGGVRTCTPVTYTVTSADVGAGSIQNTATVNGTSPSGAQVSASDSTSTTTAARPVANPDTTTGKQGQSQSVRPLTNDTPGDPTVPLMGNTLTLLDGTGNAVTTYTNTAGTYTLAGGAITFQPVPSFVGTAAPVTYRVADQRGTTTTSTYTPTVTGITPTAANDTSTGLQGRQQTIDPLANDTAGDSVAPLVPSSLRLLDGTTPVTSLTVANVGTYTVSSGAVLFQPLPQYLGTAPAVSYRVADTNGTTASAQIRVTVTGVTPTATNDTGTAKQGVPLTVDVLANDAPGAATVPLDPTSLRLLDGSGNPVTTRTLNGVGTFTVTDGKVVFTSAPGYTGTTPAVTYRIADVNGTTTTATVTITVAAVTPTASNDDSTASQGRAQSVTPLANDTAGDAAVPLVPSTLTLMDGSTPVAALTVPNQGTYTLNADRSITFQPLPAYTGTPTPVTYRVADANGTTATALYRPHVTPVTRPDTTGGLQGQSQQVAPLANDTQDPTVTLQTGTLRLIDPVTGNPVTAVTVPNQGSYSVVTGTLVFTPLSSFTGQATPIGYLAQDQVGTILADTYTPTVTALNPGLNPDTASGPQGLPLTVSPLANDNPGDPSAPLVPSTLTLLDGSGNPAATVTVTQGTYTLNADRTITFAPNRTFVGTATSVRYRVADSNGTTATSTYTPTLTPVTPTADPDTASGPQGRPLTVDVLANDDPGVAGVPIVRSSLTLLDGGGAPVTTLTVAGGTYSVTASNTITFTPTATFVGTAAAATYRFADANGTTATSTYTPTITRVTPTATDDFSSGTQGAPQTVAPLTNDAAGDPAVPLVPGTLTLLDAAGNPATSVTVAGGTYTRSGSTITFQPLPAFSGEPTPVVYRVADANGTTTSAVYHPTVSPVTRPDTTTGRQGAAQTVSPLANDTLSAVTLVPGSLRLVDPADGQTRSTVTVPNQGTYVVTGSTVTFTPLSSFVGTATPVGYRVDDVSGNTLQDTYTPTVTGVTPGANPDTTTGPQGVAQSVDPLANDLPGDPGVPYVPSTLTLLDGSGNAVTTVPVTGGTYSLSNGTITFTPNASFVGTAPSVTYRVADANGTTASSTYTPTFTAVTPSASPDTTTGLQGKVQTVDPFANDTAGNAAVPLVRGSLTLMSGATPVTELAVTGGTYRVAAGGTLTFTPTATFTGTAPAATYRIADANGTTASSTYTPTVTGVTPVIADDPISGKQGQTVSVSPLANDRSGDPAVALDPTSLTLLDGSGNPATTVTVPNEGTYTLNPDRTVTFVPAPGFTGTGTGVVYRVADVNGTTGTARITPTASAITPDALDDTTTGRQGAQQSVNPLANDLPGDPSAPLQPATLTLLDGTTPATSVTVPNEGTYVLNLDRTITFTPVGSFTGQAAGVPYRVADSNGTTDTARYRPVVTAVTPSAAPDTSSGKQGAAQTVTPLVNDLPGDPNVPLVPSTLTLLDAGGAPVTSVTIAAGTYVLNMDRTITFTPVPTFTGTAPAVRYRVADANGTTTTSTYTPTVTAVTPTATDDPSTGRQGAAQVITPLANDAAGDAQDPLVPTSLRLVDPADGQAKISVTITGQGTYTVNPDATVTFQPLPAFSGTATPVSYRVADTNGTVATARLLPTVTAVTPRAADDEASGVQGRPVTVLPLANDVPGDPNVPLVPSTLTLLNTAGNPVTTVTNAAGTYALADGRITFTPVATFTGDAPPVSYRVADANGTTTTAQVRPSIGAVAPVAVDDTSTGLQGATQSVDPLTNDRPGDAAVPLDPASLTLLNAAGNPTTQPVAVTGGSYRITDGRIVFTPDPGFTGTAPAVTYRVADVNGTTDTAEYRPTVGRVVPSAADDTSVGKQGAAQSVQPLTNDSAGDASVPLVPSTLTLLDQNGQPATSVTVANEGTYTLAGTTITFEPIGAFTGQAQGVTYRVSDANGTPATAKYLPRVTAVTPTALDDVSSGRQGAQQTVEPLANDRPGDPGSPLVQSTLTLIDPVSGAPVSSVTLNGEGSYTLSGGVITFDPAPSFSGTGTGVRYQVADSNGTLTSARYTPTVTGVSPTALDDTSSGIQGADQSVDPLDNDVPGDAGVPIDPTTLTLLDADGDAVTSVTTAAGTYTLAGTTITFSPEPGFSGDAPPVTYRVADENGTTTTAQYKPTVVGVAPAAIDDTSTGKQGQAQTVDVLANDTPGNGAIPLDPTTLTLLDANGDSATAVSVTGGTYVLNQDRTVSFNPEPGFSGTPTPVTYRIADENGSTDTATYQPVVQKVTPTALPDSSTGLQGRPQTVSPAANDSAGDPSAPIVATTLRLITSAGDPTDRIELLGVGTFERVDTTIVFTPMATFTGTTPAVTYRVADANGTTTTSTYTATVTAVAPNAVDDASTGQQGRPQSVNPLANDTAGDPTVPITASSLTLLNGAGAPVSVVTVANQGEYRITDGRIVFTPVGSFTGQATPVTYRVADANGTTDTATYTPTVTGITPTAANDATTGVRGQVQSVDPLVNDAAGDDSAPLVRSTLTLLDASNNPATSVTVAAGTYTISNGRIVFTPLASFVGTATPVAYRVADSNGTTARALYTPTVTAAAPSAADDSSTGKQGRPQSVNPLTNDAADPLSPFVPSSLTLLDGAGDPTTQPVEVQGGTYTLENGRIVFTPDPDFVGTPTAVRYRVTDGEGRSVEAAYRPAVTAVTPTATDDSSTGPRGATQSVNPITNDSFDADVPFDQTSLRLIDPADGQPTTGAVSVTGGTYRIDDGRITFTPNAGFVGTPTPITYQVADVNGTETQAVYRPTVLAVSTVLNADTSTGAKGEPQSVNPLTNDSFDPASPVDASSLTLLDADGNPATSVTTSAGVYTISNGRIVFTPDADFDGTAPPVTYRVADVNGTTFTSTYTPTVSPNDTIVENERQTAQMGVPVVFDIAGNVPGLNRSSLRLVDPRTGAGVTSLVVAGQGTWTVDPVDGTITFTPADGFTGNPTPVDYVGETADGTPVEGNLQVVYTAAPVDPEDPETPPGDGDDGGSDGDGGGDSGESDNPLLPGTGASELALPLGLAGLVLIGVGVAVIRRRPRKS